MHLFDKHQLFIPSLWVTPLYQMQYFKKQLLVMWIGGGGGAECKLEATQVPTMHGCPMGQMRETVSQESEAR